MEATYLAGAIIILLFSVILHEVMHGLAALYYGDDTAERAGRLTLNPIPHIDPIGTILVPALFLLPSIFGGGGGFVVGWAKPVPVNPLRFRDIRGGEFVVSLSGVASNFALAILSAIVYHLTTSLSINPVIPALLSFTATINLILGVFNLIPIPPLDGSKILLSQLPLKWAMEYQKLERYGMYLLLLLWFIPIGGVPILSAIMGIVVSFLGSLLNVPLRLF